MSYYVAIDGELGPQVATNSGWHGFCRWVREQSGAPELLRLADDGWADDPPALREQLQAALAATRPAADCRLVGEGLLAVIADVSAEAVVTITDGTE